MTKLNFSHKFNSGVSVSVNWDTFKQSFWKRTKTDDIIDLINISEERNKKVIWINATWHSNNIKTINSKKINLKVNILEKNIDWVIITNLDKYKDKISIVLWVADCAPIAFSDWIGNTIWLLHAGWEWISNDIIWNLINNLKTINSENINEYNFYIWPMAWEKFEFWKKEYFKNFMSFFDKWNSYWLAPDDYFEEISEEKWYINLKSMILDIFLKNWINQKQIIFSDIETNSPNNNWPSYRENWTDKRIWIFLEN